MDQRIEKTFMERIESLIHEFGISSTRLSFHKLYFAGPSLATYLFGGKRNSRVTLYKEVSEEALFLSPAKQRISVMGETFTFLSSVNDVTTFTRTRRTNNLTIEVLAKVFPLNVEQVAFCINDQKLHTTFSFNDFFYTRQIYLSDICDSKEAVKRLKYGSELLKMGYFDRKQEHVYLLTDLFLKGKLKGPLSARGKKYVAMALGRLIKGVEAKKVKSFCSGSQQLDLLRLGLTKKKSLITKVHQLSEAGVLNHFLKLCRQDLHLFENSMKSDFSVKSAVACRNILGAEGTSWLFDSFTENGIFSFRELLSAATAVKNAAKGNPTAYSNLVKRSLEIGPASEITVETLKDVLKSSVVASRPIVFESECEVYEIMCEADLLQEGLEMNICLGKEVFFSNTNGCRFFKISTASGRSTLCVGDKRTKGPFFLEAPILDDEDELLNDDTPLAELFWQIGAMVEAMHSKQDYSYGNFKIIEHKGRANTSPPDDHINIARQIVKTLHEED